MDNNEVCLVATTFDPYATAKCQRKGKDKHGHNAPVICDRPIIIDRYNQYMGGVDQADQLRATYAIEKVFRSTLKLLLFMNL